MTIGTKLFRGEAPRLDAQHLPEQAARAAINSRLLSGNVTSWRHFALTKALAGAFNARTIYLLRDKWLHFAEQVEIAKGLIPGDTSDRVYITGLDVPRWTDYAMATTGADPYPVATRPLGVPNPTVAPTIGAIGENFVDPGDSSGGWQTSATVLTATNISRVGTSIAGIPLGQWFLASKNNVGTPDASPAYVWRDMHCQSSQSVRVRATLAQVSAGVTSGLVEVLIASSASGAGPRIRIQFAPAKFNISVRKGLSWDDASQSVHEFGDVAYDFVAGGSEVFVDVTLSHVLGKIFNVSVLVEDSGTGQDKLNGSVNLELDVGNVCGFLAHSVAAGDDVSSQWNADGVIFTTSGSRSTETTRATVYLWTARNDIGEETAPSPVTAVVHVDDGTAVTVTTPTTYSAGYGVTEKVLYRTATGDTGTVFKRVAVVPLATASYVDSLLDEELGATLDTEDVDMPPADLRGIIALPNGIMVGFRRNQVCMSEVDRPHSWPVRYRRTVPSDVVAISHVDTTIVVGTKTFPVVLVGDTPENYSSASPESPQACVSSRGMTFLLGQGVVYPSPDGMMAISGPGAPRNLTEGLFTREQWQALRPETMLAATHDDVLHFWTDGANGGQPGGYMLDTKGTGFGVVRSSFHAVAAFVDPLTDGMYLVLSAFNEPTSALLPQPSSFALGATPQRTIYQFDAHATAKLVQSWRGKLNLHDMPTAQRVARVEAVDYANIVFRLYADGLLIHERAVTGAGEFSLPLHDAAGSHEIEVISTSAIRKVHAAEGVDELP